MTFLLIKVDVHMNYFCDVAISSEQTLVPSGVESWPSASNVDAPGHEPKLTRDRSEKTNNKKRKE